MGLTSYMFRMHGCSVQRLRHVFLLQNSSYMTTKTICTLIRNHQWYKTSHPSQLLVNQYKNTSSELYMPNQEMHIHIVYMHDYVLITCLTGAFSYFLPVLQFYLFLQMHRHLKNNYVITTTSQYKQRLYMNARHYRNTYSKTSSIHIHFVVTFVT